MGFSLIRKRQNSADALSSPTLPSPTTDSFVPGPRPKRALPQRARAAAATFDLRNNPVFSLYKPKQPSGPPVTPPRRAPRSKASHRGSISVPSLGATRVTTPPAPILSSRKSVEASPCKLVEKFSALNLDSARRQAKVSFEEARPPIRRASTKGRKSEDMDICGDARRSMSFEAYGLRISFEKIAPRPVIVGTARKVANRLSWSLDQRPSKRVRACSGSWW